MAEVRRAVMLSIQSLRQELGVLEQGRRLTMARYSDLAGLLPVSLDGDVLHAAIERQAPQPKEALAAAHMQAVSLLLRSANSHITHLEQCCAELAIDDMEAVQSHEAATLHEWRTRMEEAQARRHQLVLEYKALLRHLPVCTAVTEVQLTLEIQRGDDGFGFTVVGGNGASMPPTVVRVQEGGAATTAGLAFGDRIQRINHYDVRHMTHSEVTAAIKASPERLHLVVLRAAEKTVPFELPTHYACPAATADDLVATVAAMERCRMETEAETVLARDITTAIRQEHRAAKANAPSAAGAASRWFAYQSEGRRVLRLLRDPLPSTSAQFIA